MRCLVSTHIYHIEAGRQGAEASHALSFFGHYSVKGLLGPLHRVGLVGIYISVCQFSDILALFMFGGGAVFIGLHGKFSDGFKLSSNIMILNLCSRRSPVRVHKVFSILPVFALLFFNSLVLRLNVVG